MRNLALTIQAIRHDIRTMNGRAVFKYMRDNGVEFDVAVQFAPQFDEKIAIKRAIKRYQKHFGFTSKYDGKGNLRTDIPMQIPDAIIAKATRQNGYRKPA